MTLDLGCTKDRLFLRVSRQWYGGCELSVMSNDWEAGTSSSGGLRPIASGAATRQANVERCGGRWVLFADNVLYETTGDPHDWSQWRAVHSCRPDQVSVFLDVFGKGGCVWLLSWIGSRHLSSYTKVRQTPLRWWEASKRPFRSSMWSSVAAPSPVARSPAPRASRL